MVSDGHKICVLVLFIFLIIIGLGIYYRKEIQEVSDDSPKIVIRNEKPAVNAFLIKKYYKRNAFSYNKMSIHAANNLNGTELYRISWEQSINMTLTRIKDGFVVSRAQYIDRSSYSFQLFGRLMTTGKIVQQEKNQANFDIEYADQNDETFKIFLRNCKKETILFFKVFDWTVQWIDMTSRFVKNNNRRFDIEHMNPNQVSYLQERSENSSGSVSYPYLYDLYLLKHLPDEFYLTTLVVSDHASNNNCDWSKRK